MLKRISVFVIFLVAAIATGGLLYGAVGPPTETQVYAAYIRHSLEGVDVEAGRELLINERTNANQDLSIGNAKDDLEVELARYMPQATAGAIKSLTEVGAKDGKLSTQIGLLVWSGPKIRVVKDAELQEIFSDPKLGHAWERFRKTFPKSDGFVSFSRVGFDPVANQAVFIFSFACGGVCGSGVAVVMERRWGKWEIISENRVWTS